MRDDLRAVYELLDKVLSESGAVRPSVPNYVLVSVQPGPFDDPDTWAIVQRDPSEAPGLIVRIAEGFAVDVAPDGEMIVVRKKGETDGKTQDATQDSSETGELAAGDE